MALFNLHAGLVLLCQKGNRTCFLHDYKVRSFPGIYSPDFGNSTDCDSLTKLYQKRAGTSRPLCLVGVLPWANHIARFHARLWKNDVPHQSQRKEGCLILRKTRIMHCSVCFCELHEEHYIAAYGHGSICPHRAVLRMRQSDLKVCLRTISITSAECSVPVLEGCW